MPSGTKVDVRRARRGGRSQARVRPAAMAVAIAVLALGGCASRVHTTQAWNPVDPREFDPDVFYRPLDPDLPRHTLRTDEDFQLGVPMPDDRVMPEYPARYVSEGPVRVEICAQAWVDADGRVFGTAPVADRADCAPLDAEVERAFREATDAALRQWRFEPSYRCEVPQGQSRTRRCEDPDAREPVPVTRAYRFVFLRTERGVSVSGGEN